MLSRTWMSQHVYKLAGLLVCRSERRSKFDFLAARHRSWNSIAFSDGDEWQPLVSAQFERGKRKSFGAEGWEMRQEETRQDKMKWVGMKRDEMKWNGMKWGKKRIDCIRFVAPSSSSSTTCLPSIKLKNERQQDVVRKFRWLSAKLTFEFSFHATFPL